jgi:hypothetical protein
MSTLSITLDLEQEATLWRDYEHFCELLASAVATAPAPGFEEYVVAKLTNNSGAMADQMVRSVLSTGAYQYLDRWFKGRFASFVLSLLRQLRPAGYGFVRGMDTSQEELDKGTSWLLDQIESDFGAPIPSEARAEIQRHMPDCAFPIHQLFPNESIIRFFEEAEQYLRGTYEQFSQTLDEQYLDKGEQLIEFLSGFAEWRGMAADDWHRRFHDAREELRQRREIKMSWVDRVLKRVVQHRETILSR